MSRKDIEKLLQNRFLEIYEYNGHNGKWAVDTLEHEVFVTNWNRFNELPIEEQWIIRNFMDALKKIF